MPMKKSTLYPRGVGDIKGKTAIAELRRAHLIITLLSFTMMPLLLFGVFPPIAFHPILVAVVMVLLCLLGTSSLWTAIVLGQRK